MRASEDIIDFLKEGFEEPLRIMEEFRRYSFLTEKSVSSVLRFLFGESHKGEVLQILAVDAEEVSARLAEYAKAREEVLRLCIDEKHGRLFAVKTRQAKETLAARANEFITQILVRVVDICGENTARISITYDEMAR